jgi:hypothetical protein
MVLEAESPRSDQGANIVSVWEGSSSS